MRLSQEEEQMLGGKFGSAVQRAMEMLVAVGEIYGAERMVKVTGAILCRRSSVLDYGRTGQVVKELVEESLGMQRVSGWTRPSTRDL